MIKVSCVYFKDSGKFYASGEDEFDRSVFDGCIYPREYGRRLNGRSMLPGLQSGTWSGPFTVEVEDCIDLVID